MNAPAQSHILMPDTVEELTKLVEAGEAFLGHENYAAFVTAHFRLKKQVESARAHLDKLKFPPSVLC